MDYLKVGRADHLLGRDRVIYRCFEILPGFLSWLTLILLIVLSYFQPNWVAVFLIAFYIYWLLLVVYLGIYLLSAYFQLKKNTKINWKEKCELLSLSKIDNLPKDCLSKKGIKYDDLFHLIIFPMSYEDLDIIRPSIDSVFKANFLNKNIIMVLAVEERVGKEAMDRAMKMKAEFGGYFKDFIITVHPDGIKGELKGKGANQAWAAKKIKEEYVDVKKLDYDKILVSVFDIDTVVPSGYFHCLSYKFLTVSNPYRASYQPVPLYHNNIWQAPFFSRVAAGSNTFWQMMQQIRDEKLATYSSHSMTWRALVDIGFWSTNMVSEDSRITWHCFCYYNGDYRVEPLHFPLSMDATVDRSIWQSAKNLYKQQRRWGWGVENVPYLLFNVIKRWKTIDRKKALGRIFVQIYGFHSWATNALILALLGWMPLLLGGEKFNTTVLSINLPFFARNLMFFAMIGLVISAMISTLLLPKKPKKYGIGKSLAMIFQWAVVPFTIIFFGAIPGMEAQTRLMLGKYMGFQVTPKGRTGNENNVDWDQK